MSTTSKSVMSISRKWFALLRLACYFWVLVVLWILNHYEPEFACLIEPSIHTIILAMGVCVGRHYGMFFPVKRAK